jgi:diadenylate cyclase
LNSVVVVKALLTWRAALDILLVTAGLFFLYRTLLRLGTWAIFTGVLLATAVFFVANFLDLKGIEWIYTNLSHVALIAMIVIFQPELRKMFERAASVTRKEVQKKEEGLGSLVSQSLFTLAGQRRGAIVVFPGRESVNEWLSGGFRMDAKPSLPLIMSIFDPNSPGHDGALVVHNGLFTRFGVRLPVSESQRLAEEYGTRHHAAMGLAERTDALTMVVSEERGRVSIFRDGQVRPATDPAAVEAAILAHWRETAAPAIEIPKGRRVWAAVLQLLPSFIVATLFWLSLTVSQGEVLEKVLSVPVEYSLSSPDMVLVGGKDSEVRLHLAGPRTILDGLRPAQLSVKIDLSNAVPGKQSFLITDENIRLPKTVTLLDVVPPSLELTMAEIVKREIAIKPQLVGRLPDNLDMVSVVVRPDRVMALLPGTGGKGQISSITTTPLYLENFRETTTLFCKIIAPPAVQPVDKRWPDVEVTIAVKSKNMKK